MSNLITALHYLENGFSVIPVVRSSKTPCIHSWKKYQSQLPTTEEVKQWFDDDTSDANIAIVTGKISNLVVIDLDSQEAVETFRDKGWFEGAGVVKTCRGYHLYFRCPEFEVRNSAGILPGIDIRGEGGYVIAPPSIHESGVTYTWKERNILTQDPIKLPLEIIQYLKNDKKQDTGTPAIVKDDPFINGCRAGKRHDAGMRIIGRLFGKGLNETEVLRIMTDWNARNDPPLPDKDIRQMIHNVAGHESEKNPVIDIQSFLWDRKRIIESDRKKCRTPFAGENLEKLEIMMNGGLVGGCIYLLGGVPSAGKTVLVNNLADNICLQGQPVLIFSYDDSPMELNNRTLARFSNLKMEDINKQALNADLYDSLPELVKILSLKYMPDQIYPIEQWPAFVEQIISRHNRPPVIFIDYLKKLVTRKKNFDERMRIDEITRQLDNISKQYDLPIFAISELNRESYRAGQFITMASFKESGGLEYSASWLGILASFEEGGESNKLIQNWESAIRYSGNIDLVILKAKRGTGKPGRIGLNINIQKMTVHER